jgi:outer membrane protein assembly factor BamB
MNTQPGGEPVLVCMGRALVAFDHGTGMVRWSYQAEATVQRLFRVGPRVLALSGESVVCVDVATGRLVGTVSLGFQPDAGLVCGTDLVLAEGTSSGKETPRVACVGSEGTIRWRVTVESAAAGAENILRTYGMDGAKRSEIRYPRSGYRAGILYGGVVAQPDRD